MRCFQVYVCLNVSLVKRKISVVSKNLRTGVIILSTGAEKFKHKKSSKTKNLTGRAMPALYKFNSVSPLPRKQVFGAARNVFEMYF